MPFISKRMRVPWHKFSTRACLFIYPNGYTLAQSCYPRTLKKLCHMWVSFINQLSSFPKTGFEGRLGPFGVPERVDNLLKLMHRHPVNKVIQWFLVTVNFSRNKIVMSCKPESVAIKNKGFETPKTLQTWFLDPPQPYSSPEALFLLTTPLGKVVWTLLCWS